MVREERNPQSRNRTMIHIDESELSPSGNISATYQGSAFTGYSVDRDGEFSAITTYVSGRQVGMTYEINTETGVLR
ncbi:hypothetical protein IDM40_24980 [Nocardiopsis sp. HNM0947]|uniref:Uncharacterized protein n=1 Tax=Nocardiopsis coralli TaxID=2772213 RepID=A0ABR9PDM7_9ACTN|nr:hypothetical protein [Nocardiopsis coralli]MBE3001924.1 hypothetical protein [Nocardiopsis coralli]